MEEKLAEKSISSALRECLSHWLIWTITGASKCFFALQSRLLMGALHQSAFLSCHSFAQMACVCVSLIDRLS